MKATNHTTLARFGRMLGVLLLGAAGAAVSTSASATHFRGGNMFATVDGNTVTFTTTSYWRRSFPVAAYQGPLGGTVNLGAFFFGDSSSTAHNAEITDINLGEDIIELTSVITHTYSTGGPYTFTAINSCCRLSTLVNAADDSLLLSGVIDLQGAENDSPVLGNNSPILNLAAGGAQTFQLSATDPDGDPITWTMASSAQSGIGSLAALGNVISISSSGLLSWDTTGGTVGALYAAQVYATDSDGNRSALDFLIRLCQDGSAGCGQFIPTSDTPEPAPLLLLGLGIAAMLHRRLPGLRA